MTADPPLARRRAFLLAILIGAGGALYDLMGLGASLPDLRDDTWEYGVAARHLLAGDGLRTSVVHPPLLAQLRAPDATVPLLIHGPLFPALLAPFVAAWGEAALRHVGWMGAVFLLLTAWPLYRLARPRDDPVGAALAVALLPWTPLAWRALNHDAVLLLGALLFTLALEALLRERPRPGLAGLCCGLCYLARGEALLLAPLLATAAGAGARRAGGSVLRGAAGFALAFAACALPWWLHNALASGQPFFSLSAYLLVSYWPPYHGLSALLDPALTPERWRDLAPALLQPLPAKIAAFAPHAAKLSALQPSAWAAALTLIGLWTLARGRPGFVLLLAGVLASLTLLMAATVYDVRYLAVALPAVCVATAAGASTLTRPLPPAARAPAAALLLAALVVPAALAQARGSSLGARERLRAEAAALDSAFSSGEPLLLLTDIPDFAAWRTGWPAVWVDPTIAPRALEPTAAQAERWVAGQSRIGGTAVWLRREPVPEPQAGRDAPPGAAWAAAAAGSERTAPPGAAARDGTLLDTLLARFVSRGEVDYEGLRASRTLLERYLEWLARADTTGWSRAEQVAFWINAYNACTLAGVLDHGPRKSVLDVGTALGVPTGAFFRLRFRVAGAALSLNQIEHEILRGRFGDPRIHFAIVCASRSCPELAPYAYRGDSLEAQLDGAARAFLADTTRNRIPDARGTLRLSSIFRWFRGDFERAAGSLPAYVRRYLPPERAAQVRDGAAVAFLPYEWSLNARRR